MLAQFVVNAVVPTHSPERSRKFYEEVLGLTPSAEYPGGAVRYDCSEGSAILLYETQVDIPSAATVAGWTVTDLASVVAELESRGVVFEEYDMAEYGFEEAGKGKILEFEGARTAWFRDPDGNILNVTEMPG